MKRLFNLIVLVLVLFIFTACNNEDIIEYESPNVVEYDLVSSIKVYHKYQNATVLLRELELYNSCVKPTKERVEYTIYYDKYFIEPNKDFLCYKLIVNGKEIEILNGFLKGIIEIKDIERLNLPVSIVEYPYSVQSYEKVNTRYQVIDDIETKYELWAFYNPGYITLDVLIYETESYIYSYSTSNTIYKVKMNGVGYNLDKMFEKVEQGQVDIEFLRRLGIPLIIELNQD
ncbi:hypothetical protein RJG79_05315 [Mycoplasmatota bacterium WC44]